MNYLLLLLFFLPATIFAKQQYKAKDGDIINVKASLKDLNRLKIKEGKIVQIWNATQSLDIKKDTDKGEAYFKILGQRRNSFSFFLKDSFKNVYTLVVIPMSIPAQTIELDPVNKTTVQEKKDLLALPFVTQLKKMHKAMAVGDERGYTIVDVDQRIDLWKEVEMTHLKSYQALELEGQIYLLKNISEKEMNLSEQEFMAVFKKAYSISLSSHHLSPKGSIIVSIVRSRDGKH